MYNTYAGDYCVGVIPDPIPNSEVKPFCSDGNDDRKQKIGLKKKKK